MKRRVFLLAFLLTLCGLVFFLGCSENSLTQPNLDRQASVSVEEVQWIQWEPTVAQKIKTELATGLAKNVVEKIYRAEGGVIGGEDTYGISVTVPPYAFPEDKRTIIAHIVSWGNGGEGANAGVDFLPSQSFDKNVKITVSFTNQTLPENTSLEDVNIYWFNEDTGLWEFIPDPQVDLENQSVSVYINHFTRFGWGI